MNFTLHRLIVLLFLENYCHCMNKLFYASLEDAIQQNHQKYHFRGYGTDFFKWHQYLSSTSNLVLQKEFVEMILTLGSQNCLIAIDNYQNVNIPQLEFPIVHRSPQAIQHWINLTAEYQRPLWTLKKFQLGNKTFLRCLGETIYCDSHSLIRDHKGGYLHDLCIRIDFLKFTSRTKSWNCQVHMQLLPPPDVELEFPPLFRFNFIEELEQVQKSIMPMNILVSESHYLEQTVGVNWTKAILRYDDYENRQGKSRWGAPKRTYSAYIVIEINYKLPPIFGDTEDVLVSIQHVGMLHIGYQCDPRGTHFILCTTIFRELPLNTELLGNVEKIGKLTLPLSGEFTFWDISEKTNENYEYHDDSMADSVLNHLLLCENYISHTKKSSVGIPFNHATERVAHAHAHVWMTIMRNYSYSVDGIICTNGKSGSRLNYLRPNSKHHQFGYNWRIDMFAVRLFAFKSVNIKPALAYPFTATMDLNDLKFISCGKRGLEGAAYSELINVFDIYSWALIWVSSLAVSLSISWRDKSGFVECFLQAFQNTLYSYKMLLEQGGPFPISCMQPHKVTTRWVAAFFFLAGIVISNAYKNTNVYNLITLRKPVGFETFEQLLASNFSILTRAYELRLEIPTVISGDEWLFTSNSHHVMNDISSAVAESEIISLNQVLVKQNMDSAVLANILNYTSLHSDTSSFLKNFYWRLRKRSWTATSKESADNRFKTKLQLQFKVNYRQNETQVLRKFLSKCEKRALILPWYLCTEYAKYLTKQGLRHISIGKEVYANISWAFGLEILVPPYVSTSLKAMTSAGIWDHWSSFTQRKTYRIDEWTQAEVKAPTMTGNIQILFRLLLYGLFGSLFTFLVESIKNAKKIITGHS